MNPRNLALIVILILSQITSLSAADDWKETLEKELPRLGHRNWIAVVDAAYPLQTSPGVEMICTNADQLSVVRDVLASLASTKRVQPTVYTDTELNFVAEPSAPGITAYREALKKLLANQPNAILPHEQIIAKLDEAGKAFKVLLIKTPLTLPYTSVFLQLECGYWNTEKEKSLRAAMKTGAPKKR